MLSPPGWPAWPSPFRGWGEIAIALSLASTRAKCNVTYSKTAIRNLSKGRISAEALNIFIFCKISTQGVRKIYGHKHTPSYKGTNILTRHLNVLARQTSLVYAVYCFAWGREQLVTYRDITPYYRLGCSRYPTAHRTSEKLYSVLWRLLHCYIFPNSVTYSCLYPELYDDKL